MDIAQGQCVMRLAVAITCLGLFFVALALLCGCPPKRPIPPPMPSLDAGGPMSCDMSQLLLPGPGDVCQGLYTKEGWACVSCNVWGCWDLVDGVYCVQGECLSDPLCSYRPGLKAKRRPVRMQPVR